MKYEDAVLKTASMIKETYKPFEIEKIMRLIKPVSPAGEMTADAFEDLFEKLESTSTRRGYSEKSIEAARLVLVMGASYAEAAEETGQSRQAVSQLMQRISKRIESVPNDWVKVEQWLPAEVAAQIEKMVNEIKALPGEERAEFTITYLNKA